MSRLWVVVLSVQAVVLTTAGAVALALFLGSGHSQVETSEHPRKQRKTRTPPRDEMRHLQAPPETIGSPQTHADSTQTVEDRDAGTPSIAQALPTTALAIEPQAPPSATTATPSRDPLEVVAWLDDGNARWAQGVMKMRDVTVTRSSTPPPPVQAAVISCSDARVSPSALFDAELGSVVSILTPTLRADAVLVSFAEQALAKHRPKVLVVLGHAGCEDTPVEGAQRVTAATAKILAKRALREHVKAGRLLILRAHYDVVSGRVRWLDSEPEPKPREETARR